LVNVAMFCDGDTDTAPAGADVGPFSTVEPQIFAGGVLGADPGKLGLLELGVEVGVGVGVGVTDGVGVTVGVGVGVTVGVGVADALSDVTGAEDGSAVAPGNSGRSASVLETLTVAAGAVFQLRAGLAPGLFSTCVAAATWAFPSLFAAAASIAPVGAVLSVCQLALPCPSTSKSPIVAVMTLGDVTPAAALAASTGLSVSTPENAIETIETCVPGLTVAVGGASWSPAIRQAVTNRAPA
jgi:hypothetical protein